MFCNKSKNYLCRIAQLISRDSLTDRISETQDPTPIVTSLIFLPLAFIDKTYFIYEKGYGFY